MHAKTARTLSYTNWWRRDRYTVMCDARAEDSDGTRVWFIAIRVDWMTAPTTIQSNEELSSILHAACLHHHVTYHLTEDLSLGHSPGYLCSSVSTLFTIRGHTDKPPQHQINGAYWLTWWREPNLKSWVRSHTLSTVKRHLKMLIVHQNSYYAD